MTETANRQFYYRVHYADSPEFCADNAWFAYAGATRNADGSQTECRTCDTTGTWCGEPCEPCGGTGWEDSARGYSCCYTADALREYFAGYAAPDDNDQVIEFTGRLVGGGTDGEPLVIPDHVVRVTTWAEFTRS